MMSCCANCGVAGGDNIKLRKCTACHLVKYCGVKCQKEHRPKHKRACKKRAAELKDELLFKQPESSHLGECPICCLPMPLDDSQSAQTICCSKIICNGCDMANQSREAAEGKDRKCPFCRELYCYDGAKVRKRLEDNAAKMNPIAICAVGGRFKDNGDYQSAFKYFSRAAVLGHSPSHFQIAYMYHFGTGVKKDMSKAIYHYEQAAIGGHALARHNLGNIEMENKQYERAIKHLIIAAKAGLDDSLNNIKELYRNGLVSKDEFASVLRGHQAANDAMKSPQREMAEKYL